MAVKFEIILNLDEPMTYADGSKKMLSFDDYKAILDKHNCEYVCAPHVPDEMCNFNHYHIGIRTISDNTYENIAKWFGLSANSVQKITHKFESTYILYIIHYKRENKTPVPIDKVVSNFKIDFEKLFVMAENGSRLQGILALVDNGTITRYNYTEYLNINELVKWDKIMEKAFRYREDRERKVKRNMDCIFIYGDSQTGKSTFATQIAEDRKLSVFVSGGGSDVLDGYRGEQCIILDDLRPSTMALADLLKFLDNNTASSVKSRFRNKDISNCKLIIITTTKPIEQFFSEVFNSENEPKIQLMRRCGLKIYMTKDLIYMSVYDKNARDYVPLKPMRNMVLDEFRQEFEPMTDEQKLQYASGLLGTAMDNLTTLMDMGKKQLKKQKDPQNLFGDDVADVPF